MIVTVRPSMLLRVAGIIFAGYPKSILAFLGRRRVAPHGEPGRCAWQRFRCVEICVIDYDLALMPCHVPIGSSSPSIGCVMRSHLQRGGDGCLVPPGAPSEKHRLLRDRSWVSDRAPSGFRVAAGPDDPSEAHSEDVSRFRRSASRVARTVGALLGFRVRPPLRSATSKPFRFFIEDCHPHHRNIRFSQSAKVDGNGPATILDKCDVSR